MIYNNTTKSWNTTPTGLARGIVYIDNKYIEFGFFIPTIENIPIFYNDQIVYLDSIDHCLQTLYWRNSNGAYVLDKSYKNNLVIESKTVFNYPINKSYNLSKLNVRPKAIKYPPKECEFSYIKQFTFGLEYETSAGNIPWLECLNNNLVPLYDGSITGHEYVTFPLNSEELPIIHNHLSLLSKYTKFDRNCSLHIHFGGFPIEKNKIENLCKFWYTFQNSLQLYIPAWSYYVERYKSNGKAYNKVFPKLNTICNFYQEYTGNVYESDKDFYLPNQYDAYELRKWEVHGRYYNMNIMHLISGKEHKTVEFRFLRPTTNYYEIKWYLLILGAFLNYVVNSKDIKYNQITVEKVIKFTFTKNIATKLIKEGQKLYHLHKIQKNYSDYAGINQYLKDLYLNKLRNLNF